MGHDDPAGLPAPFDDRCRVFATTNRTGSGSIYDSSDGVVSGYDLTPQKARVLLQLALTFSHDPEQVQEWFDTIGAASVG